MVYSAILISKLFSAIAGTAGGVILSLFWLPPPLVKRGEFIGGMLIGGIGAFSSATLAGMIAKMAGFDANDVDAALGIGFLIGLCSIGIIGFIANFFEKRQAADIVDVASEISHKIKR